MGAQMQVLPPDKLAYNVREAAKAIGVSESTIWRDIQEGGLRPVKYRGRTLILREELEARLHEATPSAT